MASTFSNYSYGSYNPAMFTQQFVQNAKNPVQQNYQMPYNSWSAPIQKAYNNVSPGKVLGVTNNPGANTSSRDPHINPASGVWDDNYFAQQNPGGSDPYSGIRSEIESGYNNYFSQLDSILKQDLPAQKEAQEGIVNTQYNQGLNQLGSQKNTEMTNLDNTQSKSLKDLEGNIKNLFQSGNVYLGARGAGDSSAANQYSYAISKMGTQQRGDIMTAVNQRKSQITDIYNSEVNKLTSDRDTQINYISSWFSQAQNEMRRLYAEGQLSKGKDLSALATNALNTAISRMQMIQQSYMNRKSALEQWAMNRSQNISDLMANMRNIGVFSPQSNISGGMPQVTPEGSYVPPFGMGSYSNTQNEKNKLFS